MSGDAGRAMNRHVAFDALVDYWAGDADDEATQAIDEHLLGCDLCGAELDAVIALAAGVKGAYAHGEVAAYVSSAFMARLVASGVRVREYRIPHNGSVHCSVAPDDDMLLSRLQAPLAGVSRVDAIARVGDVEERRDDVPFDPASGEVLYTPKVADVRLAPAHDVHVRLLAVEDGRERELGHYTLHHQPWGRGGNAS
jgi:hypothetical protein